MNSNQWTGCALSCRLPIAAPTTGRSDRRRSQLDGRGSASRASAQARFSSFHGHSNRPASASRDVRGPPDECRHLFTCRRARCSLLREHLSRVRARRALTHLAHQARDGRQAESDRGHAPARRRPSPHADGSDVPDARDPNALARPRARAPLLPHERDPVVAVSSGPRVGALPRIPSGGEAAPSCGAIRRPRSGYAHPIRTSRLSAEAHPTCDPAQHRRFLSDRDSTFHADWCVPDERGARIVETYVDTSSAAIDAVRRRLVALDHAFGMPRGHDRNPLRTGTRRHGTRLRLSPITSARWARWWPYARRAGRGRGRDRPRPLIPAKTVYGSSCCSDGRGRPHATSSTAWSDDYVALAPMASCRQTTCRFLVRRPSDHRLYPANS